MIKNVLDLKECKRKKGKLTLEESIRLAKRRFLDPRYDSIEEPEGLASGRTSKSGNFIDDEWEDND